MDHILRIQAKQHAVVGNVLLADKKTPCFWYAPTFDPNYVMTAKVTLTDGGGAVVSGPIRGNNLGEYVMPTEAAPGAYTVAIDCEAEHAANAVSLTVASITQNFVLKNHVPTANLLEAAKAGVGVRRAESRRWIDDYRAQRGCGPRYFALSLGRRKREYAEFCRRRRRELVCAGFDGSSHIACIGFRRARRIRNQSYRY